MFLFGCALLALWPSVAAAQNGTPPTRKAAASTSDQDAALRTGVALHDQGKYDEAIAVYEEVLKQNPDNMAALYEMAYSLAEKKDYAKSLEVAGRGTGYQSEQLPMFYDLLGSSYDLMGEPQKAIDAYKKGIQVVPDASMLYYNMAITYLESLKDADQARLTLEKAVEVNPTEPAIHLMLGQVYQNNGYHTPGLFAFATDLILDPTGSQSLRAYGFLRAILRGGLEGGPNLAPSAPPDGAMRQPPSAQRPGKTDEGDFAQLDALMAASHRQVIAQMDAGTPEIQALSAQVTQVFAQLATRDLSKDRTTFVGKYYLPYFVELQKRGFVEPFLYWSIQRAPVQGVKEWLTANPTRVKAFVDWSNSYSWPETKH
jgi:hypothetical protein